MQDPSDSRRDIERFIAAGGGTFARLLEMLRDEQPIEAPRRRPARLLGFHRATCWSTALTR